MTRSLVQGRELMVMDETDVQGPEQEMVQAIHAEWVQELCDVKNELMHVRELVGVLVRRERCPETKTEIAARRLDRMEREQTEADDAEHEANLQEALANESKVLVDKWFVDKGYGFGKAPKGEIVFIHAGAVQEPVPYSGKPTLVTLRLTSSIRQARVRTTPFSHAFRPRFPATPKPRHSATSFSHAFRPCLPTCHSDRGLCVFVTAMCQTNEPLSGTFILDLIDDVIDKIEGLTTDVQLTLRIADPG